MAHEIDMSNNRANMAYVGSTPWHGLGEELSEGAPLEIWCKEAGLNWQALEHSIFTHNPVTQEKTLFGGHKALVRSDTGDQLSLVSRKYKVVQPKQIMEFYRDLIEKQNYQMQTAGSLKGGKVIWALAKTGDEVDLGNDQIGGYLLLSTSFDKTMATRAQFTSVRVVCNNTLSFAIRGTEGERGKDWISIGHNAEFSADRIKDALGIGQGAWQRFSIDIEKMANTKLDKEIAKKFFVDVITGKDDAEVTDYVYKPKFSQIYSLYQGQGQGAKLESAANTVWGAVNAVTEFVDHKAGLNNNSRLSSAWFGQGSKMKARAFDLGLALVA
jgi:phage/plasmid-like protein (TIGR03299 family)